MLYQAECSGFHRGAENHTSGSHVGCPTERRIAHFAVERHLDGCHLELILTENVRESLDTTPEDIGT